MFRKSSSPLGLGDIWPTHWPRVRMIVLRAFYDGSGKGEKTSTSRYLTLGGLAAYDNLWADFETQWCSLLRKHRLFYVHMNDFPRLQGCFEGKSTNEAETAVIGISLAARGGRDRRSERCDIDEASD